MTALVSTGSASSVRVNAEPLDPEFAAMPTATLIARLQLETTFVSREQSGDPARPQLKIEVPALATGFLPLARAAGREHDLAAPTKSPVMVELVRRGVEALPDLLSHLEDKRPTRIAVSAPGFGEVNFSDLYDFRYDDATRQPRGVNTTRPGGDHALSGNESYVHPVGDLCYLAALQIVNRHANPTGSVVMHVSGIHSPIRFPALAAAMRSDWAGLTKTEHEAVLRAEASAVVQGGRRGPRASGALQRLLFYYPDAGREVAVQSIQRLLREAPTEQEAGAWSAEGSRWVDDVAVFDWDGRDELLLALFAQATRRTGFNTDLPLVCARRLAGRGHDTELRDGLDRLIAANEHAMAASKTMEEERRVLARWNDSYRAASERLRAK